MDKPATFTETLRDPNTGELLPAGEVNKRLQDAEKPKAPATNQTPIFRNEVAQ